jgi:predicted dehydrogenase
MKTRLLLSGPGLIGKTHARLVQERDDCELVAIVAPENDINSAFAKSVSLPLFSDFGAALQRVRPDGVIISSPNNFHYGQATLCLEHGIPAFVEKPITDNIAEAEKLADMVDKTNVPLLIGHHRTYSPLIDVLLDYLRSSRFGRIVALQGSALFLKPDHYFDDGPWRKVKGGGPILINLIHEIGLMRTFAGEIGAVQAVASRNLRRFEVEDTVAISLEFANGALGTFLLSDTAASSKSWEMTAGENPAYPFFPGEACYHLAGTMGSIDFPNMMVRSYADEQGRSWWKPFQHDRLTVQRADPLALQLDHFMNVIRGSALPRVSAFDGFQNMRVLQAVTNSIETRKLTPVN